MGGPVCVGDGRSLRLRLPSCFGIHGGIAGHGAVVALCCRPSVGAAHVLGYPRLDVNQVCPLGLYGGMARGAATGGGRAACCAVHVGGCSIRPGHGLLVLVQVEQEQFFSARSSPAQSSRTSGRPKTDLRLAGARPVWYQSLNERSRSAVLGHVGAKTAK